MCIRDSLAERAQVGEALVWLGPDRDVTGLPAGRVEFIARAPQHRAAHSSILYLAAGSEREGIELQLGGAGRLSGRLQDDAGRALTGRSASQWPRSSAKACTVA